MTGSTRTAAWVVLRVIGTVAVLVTLYYQLPLDHSSTAVAVAILVAGLVGFLAPAAYLRTELSGRTRWLACH